MRVYLAGPINGCTDEEARGWRETAKGLRPLIHWVDPMARDYRGVELANFQKIVEADKRDILSCDVVLRNASRPSEGSAQETLFAWENGVRVVAFGTSKPSPWLLNHAHTVCLTLEEAVSAL